MPGNGNSAVNRWHADTTGIFTMWKSYGIQNVTDGTSNTLAFAEALVGNYAGRTGYGQRHVAVQRKCPPIAATLSVTPSSFVASSGGGNKTGRVYDISAVPNAVNLVQADIAAIAQMMMNYQTSFDQSEQGRRLSWLQVDHRHHRSRRYSTRSKRRTNRFSTGPGQVLAATAAA